MSTQQQFELDNLRRSLTNLKSAYEGEVRDLQKFLDALDNVEDISTFSGSMISSNVAALVTDSFNTSNKVGAAQAAINAAIRLGA